MNSLLPILLLAIPAVGAIVGALLPREARSAARNWALLVSIATLVVAAFMASRFELNQHVDVKNPDAMASSVQMEFGRPLGGQAGDAQYMRIQNIGFSFHLGVDTISLWLILLTGLLQPLAVAASFTSITDRTKEYYAWMLMLLAAMLGCFLARDVLLFYIFFELTLIPMFFIIGIWGGPERRYAAGKFFLFTFTGSVFTLAGVVYLGLRNPDTQHAFDLISLTRFAQTGLSGTERFWVLLAFLAGFAVKVPLFPVHTWLPLAHTEAPTAGSVILAGVLLKLGTYGLLRFAVPLGMVGLDLHQPLVQGYLLPWWQYGPFAIRMIDVLGVLAVLCVLGVIYGALVAWVQQDIKKLVAYSSVSHLGFCVLGLVALNIIGLQGSMMYMINHGLSTGALFLVIGMVYERFHTRDINEINGLARRMPIFAFFFVLFALSSIGLPGLNGFVSEFLTILGAFTSNHLGPAYAAFAATGVILGAVYMLHMVGRVIFGPLKYPHGDDHGHTAHGSPPIGSQADRGQGGGEHAPQLPVDIGPREIAILVPLAILVVVLGVFPLRVMDSMEGPLEMIRQPIAQVPSPAPSRLRQPPRGDTRAEARTPNSLQLATGNPQPATPR